MTAGTAATEPNRAPLRLTVLASGSGSNFAALADAIAEGRCHATVTTLLSDRADAGALGRAEKRAIPTRVVPYTRPRKRWNRTLEAAVRETDPELVVLAGFMRILDAAFVEAFDGRIVNVHPSLLPAFPGMHAPRQALDAGVRLAGCTVHLVDAGVDTGPILAQGAVPILPDDTEASLHGRIQRVEHRLLPDVVGAIASGTLRLQSPPQWRLPNASDKVEATLLSPPLNTSTSGSPGTTP